MSNIIKTADNIIKTADNILKNLEEITSLLVADNFRYYNNNPNKYKTGDCVVRAISAALDKSWEDVFRDLSEYTLKYKYFLSCQELYGIYLKDNKWRKHKAPRKKNGDEYLLGEWLKKFKDEAVVIIDGDHLTYVNNQIVYDIWNCTDNVVGEFWTKEE